MIKCKLCDKELINSRGLITHLRYNHKDYTTQRYYDEFLKKENEDICKLDGCMIQYFLEINYEKSKICNT